MTFENILLFASLLGFIFVCTELFKERRYLRAIGISFSIFILFAFYINWIFQSPFSAINSAMFFLICSIILLLIQIICKHLSNTKNPTEPTTKTPAKQVFIWNTLAILSLLVVAFSYFNWSLGEPRYITPDPGEHYNEMSRGSQQGKLPLFFEHNEMFEDSGNNPSFIKHHATYFPGSVAVFFLLDKISPFHFGLSTLQIFNITFYVLCVFFVFRIGEQFLKNAFLKVLFFVISAAGPLFGLVETSHSTQFAGLFFLLLFCDVFYTGKTQKHFLLLSSIPFAAMCMTYIYWAPVAVLFALFTTIQMIIQDLKRNNARLQSFKKNMLWIIFSGALSLSLCYTYLNHTLKVGLLDYSTADGGFPHANLLLSEFAFLIIPSTIGAILIIRGKLSKLTVLLALSAAIYASILFFAHKTGIVSNYARLKVFYLLVPILWPIAIFFAAHMFVAIKNKTSIQIFSPGGLNKIILFFSIILFFWSVSSVNIKSFPFLWHSVNQIFLKDHRTDLSSEQIQLLDEIKKTDPSVLDDGRLFVVAPYDTALFVYAYADIWPRSLSLRTVEQEKTGDFSSLGFFSPNIAHYPTWLHNDKNHILLYLDTKSSRHWVDQSGFKFDDYDILLQKGENKLIKLKSSGTTYVSRSDIKKNIKAQKQTASQVSFDVEENGLSGIKAVLHVKNNVPGNVFLLSLYEQSNCFKKDAPITQTTIQREDINNTKENRYLQMDFAETIENSSAKSYCLIAEDSVSHEEVPIFQLGKAAKPLLHKIHQFIP